VRVPEPEDRAGLAAFWPLSAVEERIIAELSSGHFDRIGDGSRPLEGVPERAVRGPLLRFLILGGDGALRVHEKGLRISGAFVSDVLDLEGCRIERDLGLKDCLFEMVPVLRSAVVDNLYLDGASLPGLQADRLEARGGVFLRGAEIRGPVTLEGARLGGPLECDGATIGSANDVAVNARSLEARDGVRLRGATVQGGVNLENARLGGDMDAAGATIDRPDQAAFNGDGMEGRGDFSLRGASVSGEVRALGARFGGDFDCTGATLVRPGATALSLDRATFEGAFFLRQGARIDGALDLTAARFGAIDDDRDSWPGPGDLLLNRCLYGAFIGGPVDARSRLDWLSRQDPERWGEDFWPQPYEHLSTVLREMGHDEDARAVLIAKERLQRRARRRRARSPALRGLLAAKDGLLAVTVRYGRQPLVAFLWIILFWLCGVAVFGWGEGHGTFKPNSPVVLRSLDWTMCGVGRSETRFLPSLEREVAGRAEPGQNQLDCFRLQPEASSYPEFNAFMYSLDTLLPVLEIGQKEYWRPDTADPRGVWVLNYYYFQSMVGWALSLLAIAGFSGLVKSR
jgi:hypothetical protein